MIRRQLIIFLVDTLLALAVFFVCRYIDEGQFPQWYWIIVSCLVWATVGILTQKLAFEKFQRVRYALKSILIIDILTYIPLYYIWIFLFPNKDITIYQLLPLPILIAAEIWFYYIFRHLVLRKIPFLYEDIISSDNAETGIETGIRLQEQDIKFPEDLLYIYNKVKDLEWKDAYDWILQHKDNLHDDTILIDSINQEDIVASPIRNPRYIFSLHALNDLRHMNTFLAFANYKLVDGGFISVHCETSGMRKEKILNGNPAGLNYLLYVMDYIWSRIMPKLRMTRWFYMLISGARGRNFPRVEVLGRICRAGFTIVNDEIREGEYYATAMKVSAPIRTGQPSYGPLVRLQRRGYKGKLIGVYKFRTMYAYSEFLQSYVYQRVGLQDGGKMNHDFRVNFTGKFLRKFWLDELPMLYNWLKGDLKLVGVRPLSQHYFSLYTPEMQALRITVKPGLLPPFYYEKETPKTIADVQSSERRYILAYQKSPVLTDIRYFFGSLYNIIFRTKYSH